LNIVNPYVRGALLLADAFLGVSDQFFDELEKDGFVELLTYLIPIVTHKCDTSYHLFRVIGKLCRFNKTPSTSTAIQKAVTLAKNQVYTNKLLQQLQHDLMFSPSYSDE